MKLHQSVTTERIVEACEQDNNLGFCVACGEDAYGVEPDARRYPCEACGAKAVYGAQQLLIMTVA